MSRMNEQSYPKVSVFLAVYQQQDYIRAAVDSVLAQDYPNFEIIIGDDGSTDGTPEILKDYQSRYPQVIQLILAPVNTGITGNSNRIYSQCDGKYLAFQAGDDIWLPGKISAQVAYMEEHPECSLCYHNLETFDSDSGTVLRLFNDASNPPRQGGAAVAIRYGCFNGAVANMVRRAAAPTHGFDPRLPIASDWLFWVESLLGGGEIHYMDEVFGRYRNHEKNTSSSTSRKIINNLIDHLNSGMIILANHPRYAEDVFFSQARIFQVLGNLDPPHKRLFQRISTKLSGGLKSWFQGIVRGF